MACGSGPAAIEFWARPASSCSFLSCPLPSLSVSPMSCTQSCILSSLSPFSFSSSLLLSFSSVGSGPPVGQSKANSYTCVYDVNNSGGGDVSCDAFKFHIYKYIYIYIYSSTHTCHDIWLGGERRPGAPWAPGRRQQSSRREDGEPRWGTMAVGHESQMDRHR